jgi:hypothetical protein
MNTIYQTQLAHLIKMAKIPGFKAHAWHRATTLAADRSGLFTGIDAALQEAMAGPESATACDGQTQTKHP